MPNVETTCRGLAVALKAGLPPSSPAIARGLHPQLAEAIRSALARGGGLTEALTSSLDLASHEEALLKAGEHSGGLPAMLEAIADGRAERARLRRRGLVALAYPTLLIVAGSILLPLPVLVSDGMKAYFKSSLPGLGFVAGVLVVVFGVWPRLGERSAIRRGIGTLARRLPVVGPLLAHGSLARFAEVLGLSTRAGVPLTLSLPVALEASGDDRWSGAASSVQKHIDAGSSLDAALQAVPGLSGDAHRQIALGEATGKLDDVLLGMAKDARDRHSRVLIGMLVSLTILMLILVGALVIAGIVGAAKTFYFDRVNSLVEEMDG